MSRLRFRALFIVFFCAFGILPSARGGDAPPADAPLPKKVQYNRDIRPILSDNCLFCHGFDKNKRKADLRLDTKEGLYAKLEHGTPVVPGKPELSEIISRITSKDPDEVMPPADHTKRLTAREIALIRRWVEQGGEYQGHWAYLPPKRPETPPIDRAGFARNAIDQFIVNRLKAEGLKASAEADRTTLIRRVTFDLIGLPPTADEVRAFVADTSPDAYEKVVDRLLASPRYGERMAMYWLDLVRYADTIGYHSDNPMNVSPYREWVIEAFNANKPFDQFTVEQLAGDLLPNATPEQKVASGYNRLLQTTEEGGAQAKEYVVKNFTDRVRNYSTVWLASTMGCCQCHDHKFDPFAARDFYDMAAFFADVQEAPIGRREAGMPIPSAAQAERLKKLDDQIAAAKANLDRQTPELSAAQAKWEAGLSTPAAPVEWKPVELVELKGRQGTKLLKEADDIIRVEPPTAGYPQNDTYTIDLKLPEAGTTALRLEALPDEKFPAKGPGVSPNGNFVLTHFKVEAIDAKNARKPLKVARASADFSQERYPVASAIEGKKDAGWAVMPSFGKPHEAIFEFDKPTAPTIEADQTIRLTLDFASPFPQHQFGKFRLTATTSPVPAGDYPIPPDVRRALATSAETRPDGQKVAVAAYYRSISPLLQKDRDSARDLETEKTALLKGVPTCLVANSGPPRVVKVLHRGDWQDDSGDVVDPQIPAVFGPVAGAGKRLTRLDLANWTISRQNPLTARVFVNRAWKLFFGQGLSKVLDDLGSQGEWPTHPELLDYLAVDFMESGWDVKRLVRSLVTSAAYRQTSIVSPELREKDPFNRLYARQSRFRLDAETVRDNALAASGLLVEKVGGPSVFPYQPAGYWFALNFPAREWQNDKDDGLYRRGIYTHWQRSFLHPSLLAFDAPSREEAVCERARSNIPQQALVLLNDPTYVEAARALAAQMAKRPGDDEDRIRWAFTQATSRPPSADETRLLKELLDKHRVEYAKDPDAANKVMTIGAAAPAKEIPLAEVAAWTSVARVLFNLSETITRP